MIATARVQQRVTTARGRQRRSVDGPPPSSWLTASQHTQRASRAESFSVLFLFFVASPSRTSEHTGGATNATLSARKGYTVTNGGQPKTARAPIGTVAAVFGCAAAAAAFSPVCTQRQCTRPHQERSRPFCWQYRASDHCYSSGRRYRVYVSNNSV